jgi:predicted AAA+ superfamily ATPase
MAKTNRDRIDEGLELLRVALAPFVERELKTTFRKDWVDKVRQQFSDKKHYQFDDSTSGWDVQALLAAMTKFWGDTFSRTLGSAERSLVGEIWDVRTRHAHPSAKSAFSYPDTYRALDSMARLAEGVSAQEVEDLRRAADEVLRLQFDEQARSERRKKGKLLAEGQPAGTLKAWRDIVTPHQDVAEGNFQRAEFAADLWRVYQDPAGSAPEYGDAVEFFRRTYITAGLATLLSSALKRLSGQAGDPVTQLQTNFGGGKTHSMLALYHLCSGKPLNTLPGLEEILQETKVDKLPKVARVVLVGTRISPGDPLVKPDGTEVKTLWGEMAWQLGGREAYDLIRKADETATNPNDDTLRKLFTDYGPVLILIDEWVAYARQLHDAADLPGGSFETQFTFAQALTEVISGVPNSLLIVSLPASDTAFAGGASPDESELIEVGGQRGVEALRRLRNVIGRKDSPWRAATQEESYEIVRRRLFNPIADAELYRHRDAVAREFCDMYRMQAAEFPSDARKADYERRIKAAYPVHPELFDRLYTDWASLVKFQRTRGVLRLMASVVHYLWEGRDQSPLILPGHVPLDDSSVENELTRYLEDNWVPVIEKDVDGPNSLPLEIDRQNPNLGRYSATRRVARTLYIGSAPTLKAANKGLDESRIKLGCVQPGETVAVFSDALKKLSTRAIFLFEDGARFWFSTSPSLNRLAEDEAERLRSHEDLVFAEVHRRLNASAAADGGSFAKVHVGPSSSHDVPDELGTRLVIIGPEQRHQRKEESEALSFAKKVLETRGNSRRQLANTLVFLAADAQRFDDLALAVRSYLGWKRISEMDDAELDLTAAAKRQAVSKVKEYDSAIQARLAETWCWLLTPTKAKTSPTIEWQEARIQTGGTLAGRAAHKLESDASMLPRIAPSILRSEIDKVPLWRGDHVEIRQLVEDFAKHLYLPRVTRPSVIVDAASEGVALTSWDKDGFALADSYDADAGRYRGLKVGVLPLLNQNESSLLVRPDVAQVQFDAEHNARNGNEGSDSTGNGTGNGTGPGSGGSGETSGTSDETKPKAPTEFHGSVTLSATKLTPQVAKIADEVIQHLASQLGVQVELTLNIQARLDSGFDIDTVRTVTENGIALKFDDLGFEGGR